MEKTYIAFFFEFENWGFFKFKSNHKAGSSANLEDAKNESLRLYGKVLDIGSTCLYKKKQHSRKLYF